MQEHWDHPRPAENHTLGAATVVPLPDSGTQRPPGLPPSDLQAIALSPAQKALGIVALLVDAEGRCWIAQPPARPVSALNNILAGLGD